MCTGETWLGTHARPIGLVDELSTSDAYIRSRQPSVDAYLVRPAPPKRQSGLLQLLSRASDAAASAADSLRALLPASAWLTHGGASSAVHGLAGSALGGSALAGGAATAARLDPPVWSSLDDAGVLRPSPPDGLPDGHADGLAAMANQLPELRAGGGGALEAEAARVGSP